MKGVSLKKSLSEGNKDPSTDCLASCLWWKRKVFCALLMLHGAIRRSISLEFCEVPLKLMDGTENLFVTGTISSPSQREL
jgi:hypothetical protein